MHLLQGTPRPQLFFARRCLWIATSKSSRSHLMSILGCVRTKKITWKKRLCDGARIFYASWDRRRRRRYCFGCAGCVRSPLPLSSSCLPPLFVTDHYTALYALQRDKAVRSTRAPLSSDLIIEKADAYVLLIYMLLCSPLEEMSTAAYNTPATPGDTTPSTASPPGGYALPTYSPAPQTAGAASTPASNAVAASAGASLPTPATLPPRPRAPALDPAFEAALKQLRAEVQSLKEDSWQFEAPRHQAS